RRGEAAAGLRRPVELGPQLPREQLFILVAPAALEVDHWRGDLVHPPVTLVRAALDLVHLDLSDLGGGEIESVRGKAIRCFVASVESFPVGWDANGINLELEAAKEAEKRSLILVDHEKPDVDRHSIALRKELLMTLTLVPEPIEEYAAEHTEAPAAIFEKLREETYSKMSLPQMQVGRIEGTFLKLLVRLS